MSESKKDIAKRRLRENQRRKVGKDKERYDKTLADLKARKERGDFSRPRLTIEDTDSNTYQVYSATEHRKEIASLGERKRLTLPIQEKHHRKQRDIDIEGERKHNIKDKSREKMFNRYELLKPVRHDPVIEIKQPKHKKEIRGQRITPVNPETRDPYPKINVSLEDAQKLDLKTFKRGDFKQFNPRDIHIGGVGMGDRERSLTEKDDQYFGENLVQYPTTTTGGEAWVEREGRLEHSNPMIGKVLNEDTIIGNTLSRGALPQTKPATWEGKDRYGMSRNEKLKEGKKSLTKKLAEQPLGKSVLADADTIEKVGTDLAYENVKMPKLSGEKIIKSIYANRAQPRYDYDSRASLTISNVFRGFADDRVMENTTSEFYFFNDEGEKEYRAQGSEPEPGDIIPTYYATDSYRDGKLDTGMGGRELGVYRSAPSYDSDEEVEEKPRVSQAQIDDYLIRKGSKARFRSAYGEGGSDEIKTMKAPKGYTQRIVVNKSNIQGSGRKTYGEKYPNTYGGWFYNLEGKSVKIPKQKDEPLHFRLKGKDHEASYKGYERNRREMVEEVIGEEKQKSKELGVVRRTKGGGREGVNELGTYEGVKYDPKWDTMERGVDRGSLENKKLFKDRDLKQLAMTKGISVEKKEVGGDRGRGGMYNMFRAPKGQTYRTKYEVIDGKGKEVKYIPRTQNPTAMNTKLAERPKYKRAQAPRALLIHKLRAGNPDAFSIEDDYQHYDESYAYDTPNPYGDPTNDPLEDENFLDNDEGGDYDIAQYDE